MWHHYMTITTNTIHTLWRYTVALYSNNDVNPRLKSPCYMTSKWQGVRHFVPIGLWTTEFLSIKAASLENWCYTFLFLRWLTRRLMLVETHTSHSVTCPTERTGLAFILITISSHSVWQRMWCHLHSGQQVSLLINTCTYVYVIRAKLYVYIKR